VDERYDAPLPAHCPDCAGPVVQTGVVHQHQEELPVTRVVVRQFDVHVGRCDRCGHRVQARHPLINRLAERLDRPSRVPDVQRFAAHLTREFPAIWSFLFDPTIDATNWRAEHAIRPAVVTRKVWGGNRTWRRAHAQQTLGSIIRTAHQRHLNPHAVLVSMLHAREPIVPPVFQATTAN